MAAAIATGSAGWSVANQLSQLRRGLTPCMPCSFGLLPHPRSPTCALPSGLVRVTVTIRCIQLVTAAYGTWVARMVRTTIVPLAATVPGRPEG
jgi:hypothetical protein